MHRSRRRLEESVVACIVLSCGVLFAMKPRAHTTETFRLENARIAVEIDRQTGAIRSIRDKEQDIEYPFSGIGFDVTTETGSVRSESAAVVKTGRGAAELRFTAGGLEIGLCYSLGPEDRFIEKWLEIKSEDGKPYFLKSVVLENMTTETFTEIHFHDDQTIWHCPINLFLRGEKGGCFAGLEYPYWDLEQKGKEGFRLGYRPNYHVAKGEVNVSEKYFLGVYRKEGILRVSQGPYPGRGRYKALSWDGKAGLVQHFKAKRIPAEVKDVPLETLDWGEVWAMQEFMRHVLPDDLPLPEDGFWIWQNGWWAGVWNIKPEILDRLKQAGIHDVMTAHTWYGRGNHPLSPPYIDQMRTKPMGFPKDSGIAGMPGPAGPAAGLHANHKDVKLDSFVPGKYTPEFCAPPAMEALYEHGRKIGVHVSSFSLPCVYFKDHPEWASIDEEGKVSEYLFGRKVSCPACDAYMEHMLNLLDHVFAKYKPRWWGFDGRWLSYWEVPMYRPGPKGLGFDTCHAKNHGHLPGDNLYKEWTNIQKLVRELRRRHPRMCIEHYLGLKRGGPWALRYFNCDDNYYETNGALMNRFETWHNQNDRFRPVYKNYAAIFGGSLAEFRNNVISSISATSYCQVGPGYKDLALEENRDFLKKWRAWATRNYAYLKVKRDLFGCPSDSPVDGSAHIIKDRGFLFLFPVGGKTVRASIPVNRWLPLEENQRALYQMREIYPREGTDLGVYRYGEEFLYDMSTDSPVILALEPAASGSKPHRPALGDQHGQVQIVPAFSSIESHSRAPEPMREQAVQNRNAHNAQSDALKSEKPEDSSRPFIINGTDWLDTEGRPILAHDGHITRVKDSFYWYGSSYAGNPKGKYGTAAGFAVWNGIQVYSSQDLVNWKHEGVALPRPKKGWGVVGSVGRAHVIYNDKTRKYVMWYWYHTTYPTVFAMVATSGTPVGPFEVMGAREVGSQTGFGSDLNVFKDDDGKAYLVYTDHHTYDASKRFDKGKGVYAILVDSLTDDYMASNKEGVVAIPSKGEAPAMAKYQGKYIVAASGVEGWNPTETRYVLADSPLGPYSKPAIMSEQKTWGGQITSFLYIKESDTLMAMCDQWWTPDKTDLNKSRYLWFPVDLNPQSATAKMQFQEEWNPFRRPSKAVKEYMP